MATTSDHKCYGSLEEGAMNKDKISNENLITGYRHLVRDNDYLGGRVGFLERRITVAQVLEELANGITVDELSTMYSLPQEAVTEAIRYASTVVDLQNAG